MRDLKARRASVVKHNVTSLSHTTSWNNNKWNFNWSLWSHWSIYPHPHPTHYPHTSVLPHPVRCMLTSGTAVLSISLISIHTLQRYVVVVVDSIYYYVLVSTTLALLLSAVKRVIRSFLVHSVHRIQANWIQCFTQSTDWLAANAQFFPLLMVRVLWLTASALYCAGGLSAQMDLHLIG